MAIASPRAARYLALSGTFAAVAVVVFWLARPLQGGPAGPDAASSVLFFDRIASGQRLETWVNTTPKPLLTLVLGGLHGLSGDWRPGAVASVLITALGMVLAVELVRRVAGIEAGVFAGVALVGSLSLEAEANWSYGLPWAFALWMAAGLALIRPSPRYGLAGGFLLLASLVRPETFIFLGVALLLLGWQTLRGPRPPRAAWLVMLGGLAVVGYCLHDLLLTGDPLWWTKVAAHSVELSGGHAHSLGAVILSTRIRLLGQLPLVLPACAGGLLLLYRRAWVPAAGLIAMGPLVIVYTWLLAARRLNVLSHYFHPLDLAIILGASIGIGVGLRWLRVPLGKWTPQVRSDAALALSGAAAIVLAIVLSRPFAPLSPSARRSIALESTIAARLVSVEPVLSTLLGTESGSTPTAPGPMGLADAASVRLFVPAHRAGRLAIDLGLPLTQIAAIDPARVDPSLGYPRVGSIVYLDGTVEPASAGPRAALLQVTVPTVAGPVRIVPIETDPAERLWIVRIAAP